MKFKEIETKYSAKHISIQEFSNFCASLRPTSSKQLSSPDHYFTKSSNEFLRYRAGNKPELTIKKKTSNSNNYVRLEVNLPLDSKTPENKRHSIVKAFCRALGFFHNFTIYKTCFIYYYNKFNLVYYIVYDTNLIERARLLEIEMDEEYPWTSEAEAWSHLKKIEKKLKSLNITEKARISESLFEMFRKA